MNKLLAQEWRLLDESWFDREDAEALFERIDALNINFARRQAFRVWVLREYRRGNPQEWVRERQRDFEHPEHYLFPTTSDAHLFGAQIFRVVWRIVWTFDYLKRHNRPIPDFQPLAWSQVVELVESLKDEVFGPQWEKRYVLYRYEDGWTLERVETPSDLELEGELMRNCASALTVGPGETLLSLRNPDGRPRVNIFMTEGDVDAVLGRGNSPFVKPKYVEKIQHYFASLPGRTYWVHGLAEPTDDDQVDEYGLYSASDY